MDEPTNDVGQEIALYTESFARRHARSSRLQLIQLAKEEEDARQAVEQRVEDWDAGAGDSAPRFERVANNEVVNMGEQIAKGVWIAGGIMTLRWISSGDNCPFCDSLNGKVVGIQDPFVAEGAGVQGNADQNPMISKQPKFHPPLHRGCDCVIVPG